MSLRLQTRNSGLGLTTEVFQRQKVGGCPAPCETLFSRPKGSGGGRTNPVGWPSVLAAARPLSGGNCLKMTATERKK